jgi:sialic acid synthase SpsE
MATTKKKTPKKISIKKKLIGQGEPTFFIAEIGNNHNGDYYLAKKTIEEAAKAGVDAVKFQKRFIDEVFAKELRDKPQTKDQVLGKTYGEYRQSMELDMGAFVKLKAVADSLGLIFFATPFDRKSADFLEEAKMDLYKIASFDVTNTPLLEYVAKKGKPIILSAGMSTIEELDEAVATILKHNDQLIILHCVSIYPTPDDKLNLQSIPFLQERYYPIPVGYSGHEADIIPTLASIALGAKVVERHITLDKSLPGPDHATISINPEEFAEMIRSTRRIEKALGIFGKELQEDEKKTRDKHSKSIVSKIDIPAGKVITKDMLTCKSPGYGMKPNELSKVIGKKSKVAIEADSVITRDHIKWK